MILDELELAQYFEWVIGMNAGHAPKPDPASTIFIMNKFSVRPEHTVYIGDSCIDAETSRNAGIDFAWVNYGYDTDEKFTPQFYFSSALDWSQFSEGK